MKSIIIAIVFILVNWPLTAQDVTMGTLLQEMISREKMAMFPQHNYETLQFSSYDRKANVPGGESWFANHDHTKFLRREITENGEEWVMFDARYTGAIVRWWMTFGGFIEGAGDGIIRVYIDGSEDPVIEGTAYDVMSGGQIVGPPLSSSVSELTPYKYRGHNLYLPIPYMKSCKITYQSEGIKSNEKGEIINNDLAIYYVINYRQYDSGIDVESFNSKSLNKYAEVLNQTQLSLAMPFNTLFAESPQKTLQLIKLRAGDTMNLEILGEKYIKALTLRLDADSLSRALRSTIISLTFDEQKTLSMPLAEFFGTGYQINPYETFYTKVFKNGTMISAWPMPFQSSAKITLSNIGDQEVKVEDLKLYADEWRWNENSLYFGGSWKQYHNKQTGGPGNPEDLTFNELEGKGVYAGDLITLYNSASAWWGEGDEKIYLDGEEFPSHFGTGTEDYYGYAWGRPEVFSHPFIAQPDGSGNLEEGTTVNIRWRGLDKIPFQKSLKMTMDLWHWRRTQVNYAPATFFYLRPGGESLTTFNPMDAKKPLAFPKTSDYNPILTSGIIQGEDMEPTRIDAGVLRIQKGKIWNDQAHIWWRNAAVGDELHLSFNSDQAYNETEISLQLTKAKDYGIVEIILNNQKLLTFDGYAPEVVVETVIISDIQIKYGFNTLKIHVQERNENALEGNMFGIDYLKIKK